MAKTFNRIPSVSSTPSNSDLKSYDFTQTAWNGIISDKNFLEADQNSFSDAKNVYVNEEGLLRSRPSCKKEALSGVLLSTYSISDVEVFDKVIIYIIRDMYDHKHLHLVNNYINKTLFVQDGGENVKLISSNDFIYLFYENELKKYDVMNNTLSDAKNDIYIPINKIISGNTTEVLESPNILTSSYKERYLFTSKDDINYDKLVNKDVNIELGNTEYNVTFKKDLEDVFVEEKLSLLPENFETIDGIKIPLISISEKNTFIISNLKDGIYTIYYSTKEYDFIELPKVSKNNLAYSILDIPKISKDGNYAYYLGQDDVYVYSLVDTGIESQYFTQWTPLIKTLYPDYRYGWYLTGKPICEMDSINNFIVYYLDYHDNVYDKILHICNNGVLNKYDVTEHSIGNFTDSDIESSLQVYVPNKGDGGEILNTVVSSGHSCRYNVDLGLDYYYNIIDADMIVNADSSCDLSFTYTRQHAVLNKEPLVERVTNHTLHLDKNNTEIHVTNDLYVTYEIPDGEEGYFYCNFYVNKTVMLDIYYGGYPEYSGSTYNKRPNIKCIHSADSVKVLIDAGALYYLNIASDTIERISLPYDIYNYDKNDSTCNALYLSNNTLKYTRTKDDYNTRLYTYNITSNSVTKKDYIHDKSNFVNKNIFTDKNVLLNNTIMYTDEYVPLLFDCLPICHTDVLYVCTDDKLYTSDIDVVTIDIVKLGKYNYLLPDLILKDDDTYYFSKDKTLYTSAHGDDKNFKWYIPDTNVKRYDETITNLHRLSSTEIAVFVQNGVHYVKKEDNHYLYYKSNIPIGCKKGNDIITSFDGKYTIFATERGLVAMTYQQFIATDEQSLTYLTDLIYTKYKQFYDKPVKLFKYLYWIACYKEGSSDVLLYDLRNSSWWYMNSNLKLSKIVDLNDGVKLIANNQKYGLDFNDIRYYDYDGINKYDIEWYINSQILHFNSINNSKNLRNFTVISVLDSDKKLNFNLQLYYYRKVINESKEYLISYKVDAIRTFVKHLNAMKVNQARYVLSYDAEAYEKLPLSLSSINIEYKITRQVR